MSFAAFNQTFFWVFISTNIFFCLLFCWKLYAGYRAANGKAAVIIKAVVSLVIWIAANIVIIAVSAGYFYADTLEAAEQRNVRMESATFYLISFIIGWILIGAWIIYWMNRPTKHKDYGSN